MSFWDTDDGQEIDAGKTEFEIGGGNRLIPDGSSVLALIDEAEWRKTQDQSAEFISLRWSVLSPDTFKNQKVWQKLFVSDLDPNAKDIEAGKKKRDKAKRMLAAIDANAGGKLIKLKEKPTDDHLAVYLMQKPMVIRLGVWEMNGNEGNWVQAVAPKTAGVDVKAEAPRKLSSPSVSAGYDDSDEIPF